MNSKDFRNYDSAFDFAKQKKEEGYKAIVQDFFDFDGRFYSVLYW